MIGIPVSKSRIKNQESRIKNVRPLILNPFLHAQWRTGQNIRNALACAAIAIQVSGWIRAVLHLTPDRVCDDAVLVVDIHDIRPTLAAVLPRTDVDRRRADEGALANRRT